MIICPKCGSKLTDDAQFCSYCGARIEEITPPPIQEEYIEQEHAQSQPVHQDTTKQDTSKLTANKKEDATPGKKHRRGSRRWFAKILLVIFVLGGIIAFLSGAIASGIVAVLQVILAIIAIKAPKRWIRFILLMLAIALLVPYVGLVDVVYSNTSVVEDKVEEYLWSDIVLADILPEPESSYGKAYYNTDTHLELYVKQTSAEDYSEYVDACKEKGFTVDAEQSENSYSAYNAEGYELSLSYVEYAQKMTIEVEAAEEYGTLVWPDSGFASLLPTPESTTGKISKDNEHGFSAYVSNMPLDDYNAYVAECADLGFTVDASQAEKSYSAENSDGNKLSVKYQGNGVIFISVEEPKYEVSVEIECVENLLFSTYDVVVYVDGTKKGTIDHGGTKTYSLTLAEGSYEIKFVSAEDEEVTGSVTMGIDQDKTLQYRISCTSTQIKVETIEETDTELSGVELSESSGTATPEVMGTPTVTATSETTVTPTATTTSETTVTPTATATSETTATPTGTATSETTATPIATTTSTAMETSEPTEEPEVETVENLTVENCPDLAALLALRDPGDASVATFASKYSGQIIEFDGCVLYIASHGTYTTRWDVLLGAGDYDENSTLGPNFHLTNVSFYDMNVSGGDSVYAGLNVHIIAKVGSYNSNTQLFELDIISMEIRD